MAGVLALGQAHATGFQIRDNSVKNLGRANAGTAVAQDARVVRVRSPLDDTARVAFLGSLQSIDLEPAPTVAKVILNARTGSVVMNQNVRLENCAVAHGNLSVVSSTMPANAKVR